MIKLNAGFSRKAGEPDYRSRECVCRSSIAAALASDWMDSVNLRACCQR